VAGEPQRILVTEFMDEAALAALAAFQVDYRPDLHGDRAALVEAVAHAHALIVRNRTRVDADLIAAAPALRVVGRLGVGLDNIDVDACERRGIAVLPATGANAASVAEYVIAAAMALVRGAFTANAAMLAGEWPRATLGAGGEMAGRTLGLVGLGATAQAVAMRARALGMAVLAHDPPRPADDPAWRDTGRRDDLHPLLREVDVLSLHVPLTDATRCLIGAKAIGQMRPRAVLVNTARGGIVDEAALADALRTGRLGGAALDVFETEPLTAEAAAIFEGVPNLILTPHIAGVTRESNTRVSAVTADNVRRALS
jgi:(S)-sulfolactate dehydrogenase